MLEGCAFDSDESSHRVAGQMLAEEPHSHAAFASGGRDHLGRPRANVADREHAGPVGLDQERFAPQGSPWLVLGEPAIQCRTGEYETVIVEGEFCGQPLCRRLGADEYDHRLGLERLVFAVARFLDGDSFETSLAVDGPYLAAQQHFDGWVGGDSLAQIPCHARL